MALRKIKLYGKLGQIFGKEWILDVNSVAEAVRAIDSNTKGKFSLYLLKGQGSKQFYKISVKNKNNIISENEINGSFGSGDIYITPYIRGSGKYGKLIAGVVLIAVSYYMGGFNAGAASGASGSTAMWGAYIGQIGISLTLGGIAQLLATSKASSADQRNSSLFQGNATTVYQGTSVGITYGRAMVSPMPVCISSDSLSQNSYDGQILQVGKLGLLLDTDILYSYKGGTASLCGFSEYTDPSTPPKKYLRRNFAGEMIFKWASGCDYNCDHAYGSGYMQISNSCIIDPNTCNIISYGTNNLLDCYGPATNEISDISNPGISTEILTKTSKEYIGNGCGSGWVCSLLCDGARIHTGSLSVALSEEDTELNAINRLLQTLSWSPWQSTPVYPYYYRNPANFDIYYREVRTKTVTTEKYNPSITYKCSAIYQRRAYGSSDPWVDAETVVTSQKPNSSGDFEIDTPNVSGYETKLKNLTISL